MQKLIRFCSNINWKPIVRIGYTELYGLSYLKLLLFVILFYFAWLADFGPSVEVKKPQQHWTAKKDFNSALSTEECSTY